ncbi:MAG: hypothetical protein LBL54_00840 [Clostridiales Family XIII bacterium]|jgi:hypothetical protein|nr:hypothetical protein [Clostridiales Family XIII bacterium]
MNIVQSARRAVRKDRRAFGMLGILIAALVLASAFLAACGAGAESGSTGSDAPPGGGADAPQEVDADASQEDGLKAPAESSMTGETNERGEADPEDSATASSAAGKKTDDEGGDMVGLYISIIDTVWKEDAGLNPGKDGMLAIDVEEVDNLSAGEKDELVQLAGLRFGIRSLASTFEQLEDEGYIDGRLLQFKEEDGMIIEISTSDVKEDSFNFKISKWVSGLGADWYSDCTASKTDGVWDFELGGFAVS